MKINLTNIDIEEFLYNECEDTDSCRYLGAFWAQIAFKLENKIDLSISEKTALNQLHSNIIAQAMKGKVEFQ